MGSTWEEFLQPGSYKGVEFDFLSTTDKGGQDLDEQEFPGRDGEFVQPRSAKGKRHDISAVFIEDDYPDVMNDLIEVLDEVSVGEFVHPVFGSLTVAVDEYTVTHDVEDGRDCATIRISFIEHTDSSPTSSGETNTIPALANGVRSSADALTAAADDILDPGFDAAPEVKAAAAQAPAIAADASTAADTLEAGSGDISIAEIQSQVNSISSRINAVAQAVSDYSSPEMYTMGLGLNALALSLSNLGNTIIAARPPLVTRIIRADIPLLVWVQMQYPSQSSADLEDRVSEIVGLNDIPDPLLVPTGTRIRCYAQ